MTNPTTPFSWQMPTASDLVTDLPADFETFGQAVATSMADLLGGTTGQVLSKASNTDMDFTWVAQDDSNAIQNSIVDAKGDLIAASAADTPARLAVGANDLFLTAASGEATGLKWSGTWTSFTPTWTNLTVGNGTGVYKYQQIGKQIFARYKFTLGSTSAIGTNPNVTLPINPASGTGGFLSYSVKLTDSGVGTFNGAVDEDSNKLYLASGVTSGSFLLGGTITATSPFTWTTGDSISFDVYYEGA
jgi:hypothetical protein